MKNEAIAQGHYAKKQLLLKDRLIGWSHRSRFEMGLRLAREFDARRILDYGCGDGTLLAMLASVESRMEEGVGCELYRKDVEDCQRRFDSASRLRFCLVTETDQEAHRARYDLILCMEVLEHVVDLDTVIDRLKWLLADGGTLVVSVPVEIGPSLLLKQTARRIAGWRGLGDYPGTSPYTWPELAASLFAGPAQHIERPLHRNPDGTIFHDHKGFNWKALRQRFDEGFVVEQVLASPVNWLPVGMASQAWFILRRRGATSK